MRKIILFIILIVSIPCGTTFAAWNTWVDNSLVKIKQDGSDDQNNVVHSGNQSITIKMAKNEFESFQIFIYANGESLSNVDVSIGSITNGNNTISDVYLYKEWYTNCSAHSRPDYTTGYYPTALLPKVDRYYHETRNTFPFSINTGNIQGVWVDIGTEISTAPGTYHATITITAQGKAPVELPLTVEVVELSLGQRNNTFLTGHDNDATSYAHMGTLGSTSVMNALVPLYLKQALLHNVSIRIINGNFGVTYQWDSGTKTLSNLTTNGFDTYYRAVLDGTAVSSGPYANFKMTATVTPHTSGVVKTESDGNIANADKSTAATQYLQLWYDHFVTKGWITNTTLYTQTEDEPTGDTITWRGNQVTEYQKVIDQGNDFDNVDISSNGNFYIIANKHNVTDLTQFTGLYDPWIGHYAPANWEKTNESSSYIYLRSNYPSANKYWTYLSCMNNGCANGTDSQLAGQMDLSADAPSIYNIIFGAYAWLNGNTDIWYFHWNDTFRNDPYDDLWPSGVEGSNGDGSLVYPGVAGEFGGNPHGTHTPNIGGIHDIPIAGIRLKHIRDAMDDFAKFKAADSVDHTQTVSYVQSLFTNNSTSLRYWNINMDKANYKSTINNVLTLAAGSPTCDSSHLSLCNDSTSCQGAGGNWCGGTCQSSPCGTAFNCGSIPLMQVH